MEAASGQDLRPFFTQWLTRTGVPASRVRGDIRLDESNLVSVRQVNTADPYEFPLELGISGASVPPDRENAGRGVTPRSRSGDAEPASVTLDPNVSLLAAFGALRPVRNGV